MKLYDDSIELTFQNEGHKYLVSKKVGDIWLTANPVPGVSTFCGALSKDFLAPWAAKLAAEYAIDHAKDGTTKAVLLDEAKKQHKIMADVGARAGKLGHLFVEAQLNGKKVTMPSKEEDKVVVESVKAAYEAFMEDWKPEIVSVEQVLYSKEHNYAGTADLVCKIKGKLVILDWKTTNTSTYNPDGIYVTYFAQLGAYSLAYEEMTGEKVDDLWAVNLPKNGGKYKLKRLEDLKRTKIEAQAYFLSLKQAYEMNQQFQWSLSN